MFGINIGVFTHGARNYAPRWTWTSPDPELLSSLLRYNDGSVGDILLYNSDLVHYDLLAERDSQLVNFGPVSLRLQNLFFGNVSNEFSFNIDIGNFDIENMQLSQIETPRPLQNRLIT